MLGALCTVSRNCHGSPLMSSASPRFTDKGSPAGRGDGSDRQKASDGARFHTSRGLGVTAEPCPSLSLSLSLSSGIQFPSRKRPLPAFALLRSGAGHTVQCSRLTGRRTPLGLGPGSPGGSPFDYVVTVGGSKDDASLGILTPSVYIYLRSFHG